MNVIFHCSRHFNFCNQAMFILITIACKSGVKNHNYKRVQDEFTNFKILNIVELIQDNAMKKIKLKPEFAWLLNKKILNMIQLHN